MLPQPVEKLILAALQAAPGLTDLVGDKIYALKMPTGIILPALTSRRISGTPFLHLRGYQNSKVQLALDVWAMEYGQAREIALEVQKAMFAAPVVNWPDGDEAPVAHDNYYQVTLEYTCIEKGGFEK